MLAEQAGASQNYNLAQYPCVVTNKPAENTPNKHRHATDSRLSKIDTEDKGISFPVGERSTLKG